MALLTRTIFGFLIALLACFSGAASADDAVRELRIGVIDADPGRTLGEIVPFVEYLKSGLRRSGIRDVRVSVARDLDQMRDLLQEGKLDLVLTSAFPLVKMGPGRLVPALLAWEGGTRECPAVFFVRKKSPLKDLRDLQGRTVVFETPSSTAGYALARAELIKNGLTLSESTAWFASGDAVRYEFAGEPINQAFRVILNRADAGVFSSSDWEKLPPRELSQLRVLHRTAPVICLVASFRPSFPPALREAVDEALITMSGNREGQAALGAALHSTRFERLTEKDEESLQGLRQLFSHAD